MQKPLFQINTNPEHREELGEMISVSDARSLGTLQESVHTQLITYLENNNLLPVNQFGFRSGHSINMAITTLLLDIYESYNLNKYTKPCYIELKKAFDTVSHEVLYGKMESVGITGETMV